MYHNPFFLINMYHNPHSYIIGDRQEGSVSHIREFICPPALKHGTNVTSRKRDKIIVSCDLNQKMGRTDLSSKQSLKPPAPSNFVDFKGQTISMAKNQVSVDQQIGKHKLVSLN